MEQSILNRDLKLEASFSFSGQDFSRAVTVVSDDFEEEEVNDDQYIEIALERHVNGHHLDDGTSLEFRISFSSSVPFLQLHNCGLELNRADTVESIGTEFSDAVTTPLSTSSSTSASALSSSSNDTRCRTRETAAKAQKTVRRRVVQFRSFNRLRNSLLANPAASSETVSKKNATPERESCSNNREFIRSR